MLFTEKSQMYVIPDLWIGVGGGGDLSNHIKCALSQSNRSEKCAESYPAVLPITLKDNHYPQGNK